MELVGGKTAWGQRVLIDKLVGAGGEGGFGSFGMELVGNSEGGLRM